jgi:predicted GIY-YIG superfamily endonuclease
MGHTKRDEDEYKISINGSKIYLCIGSDCSDTYSCEHNNIDMDLNNVSANFSQIDENTIQYKDKKMFLLFKKILFYTYVLELNEKKYYVGKSSKPMKRVGDHCSGGLSGKLSRGSGWTHHYEPLKILEINEAHDPMEEDFTTLRYMYRMGIDNVRGGSFCELNLSQENIHTLEKMIKGTDDRCYFCGSSDHLIASCDRKNVQRKTTKYKEKKIPKKEISKTKILKCYGAEQLLSNSTDLVTNIPKDPVTREQVNKIKCKYCKMPFQSMKKMTFHSEYKCPLNKKNQLFANVDRLLEENGK